MNELLGLPANLRQRIASGLATGTLRPPYPIITLRSVLGESVDRPRVREALLELDALGLTGRAAAAWIRTSSEAIAAVPRPQLVWTGPEVPGLHARDTSQVFREMLGSATESIWASTYTYFDGPKAFDVLARRMDECPTLEVTLLVNVARKFDDERSGEQVVVDFARRFWGHDWPGNRRPRVFYDPRGLERDHTKSVLHAKALVQDERLVLVTSANFTEAAMERNIELGMQVADTALATQTIRHFQRLIEQRLLLPLPA